MSLKDRCQIIEFKDLGDERGKLVVIEGGHSIPFDIQRVFYLYGSDSRISPTKNWIFPPAFRDR